jgi:hypothetical protein
MHPRHVLRGLSRFPHRGVGMGNTNQPDDPRIASARRVEL